MVDDGGVIKMSASLKQHVETESAIVANRIKQELQAILGDNYQVVSRTNKFGLNVSCIYIEVCDINPLYGIEENSPAHMKFLMHLTDAFGRPTDLDKVSFEQITAHYKQSRAGIKFRKISSNKSIDDCASKLIKWFEKNKPELDKLIAPDISATS
jgi:hypothetical protein